MNKKLVAVAVAGLFVAPAAALAQTSVTITGKLIASFGNYNIAGRSVPAGAVAGRAGEGIVRDESSRLIFLVREDLGGGLTAIGKLDFRPSLSDTGAFGNTGESYVGLDSKSWGTLSAGRFDLHYGNHASYTGVHSGLLSNPTALFDVANAGASSGSIANQSRTNNVIRYGSPKWGDMFELVVAYSTNPTKNSATPTLIGTPGAAAAAAASTANENENDLKTTNRRGRAWNVNPKIWGKNWEAGYSYWTSYLDTPIAAPAAATGIVTAATTLTHQRGNSIYGTYVWSGFRAGLAWNRSRIDTQTIATGASATTSNRSSWGIPLAYTWGNHNIYMDIYRNSADKAAVFAGLDTKARFFGLTYGYDLSKRTSAALSYASIKNGSAATYNLFASSSGAALTGGALAPGEDPRFIAVTLQHRF